MYLTLLIYADIKSFKEAVLINSELRLAEINKNNYYFMPVFFNACILFSTIFSMRKMMKINGIKYIDILNKCKRQKSWTKNEKNLPGK